MITNLIKFLRDSNEDHIEISEYKVKSSFNDAHTDATIAGYRLTKKFDEKLRTIWVFDKKDK